MDVYGLKDEIVVAAAALFHGPTFEEPDMLPTKFFDEVLAQLVESNVPGCIVMTNKKDDSVYIVYVFAGQIVGIHCSAKGWLQPDLATVYKHLHKKPDQRVQACILPCQNVVEVNQYSFSLSGLGDRDFSKSKSTDKYDVLNIFYLLRMDRERMSGFADSASIIQLDRFMPKVNHRHQRFLNRLSNIGSFAVRP